MYLKQLGDPSKGAVFNDHGQRTIYGADGFIEKQDFPEEQIRISRMASPNANGRMNSTVIGALNFGIGLGRPLELNTSVDDVGGDSYKQDMIQSDFKNNSLGSSFYFGQQDRTPATTISSYD